MTTDLLFIELGAVVTEITGPNQCTMEPYCDLNGPTYNSNKRVAVDFAESLGHVPAGDAKYDQIVHPAGNRVQIGPGWPGGGYEGILCVRETFVQGNGIVQGNAILGSAATALQTLQGPRCRYQVIASVTDDGEVRRYHGFLAHVVQIANSTVFKLVNLNGQLIGNPITYNPNDLDKNVKFHGGNQVEGIMVGNNIVDGSVSEGGQGAVFMNLDAFDPIDVTWILAAAPKQPPGAGL